VAAVRGSDPQYWDEMCPELSTSAVMQHVKSDKADNKRKQTIKRSNSSKSENLQAEQARKNAEMKKKKAEKEIKMTQIKAARDEKEQKKARPQRPLSANKRTEIEQNRTAPPKYDTLLLLFINLGFSIMLFFSTVRTPGWLTTSLLSEQATQ
jgi:flagellar biosynthesis GTPase FlhF